MVTLTVEMKIQPVLKTHLTTDGMIKSILSQMDALEPRRKYMFIAWLHAHTSRMKNAKNIREGLNIWFDSMSSESIQWEYRLIAREIEWWCEQSEQKVELLMIEHFTGRY